MLILLTLLLQTLPVEKVHAESALFLRFDPGYYYDRIKTHPKEENLKAYIGGLVKYWKENHVTGVYLLLHSPEFGAFYPSKVKAVQQGGVEPTLGKTSFVRDLIQAGKKEKLTFYAFFYFLRSKKMWDQEPTWRAPNCNTSNEFLLDVREKGVRNWYEGLVTDTLKTFPTLAGIDLSEPMSENHCMHASREGTRALTQYISHVAKIAHTRKKEVSITPNLPINESGKLWTETETQSFFGFSLKHVLSESKVDYFLPQLDFHQWQKAFPDKKGVFNLSWSLNTFSTVKKMVPKKYRGKTGIHLELFAMSSDDVQKVRKENFTRVDYYETELARKRNIQFYAL